MRRIHFSPLISLEMAVSTSDFDRFRTGYDCYRFSQVLTVWNCRSRIGMPLARTLTCGTLSVAVEIMSPNIAVPWSTALDRVAGDLDTPDELGFRSLPLGVVHRTARHHDVARCFLVDARQRQPDVQVNTWIGSVALYSSISRNSLPARAGPGRVERSAEARQQAVGRGFRRGSRC
jgi:hypothetical protein